MQQYFDHLGIVKNNHTYKWRNYEQLSDKMLLVKMEALREATIKEYKALIGQKVMKITDLIEVLYPIMFVIRVLKLRLR